MRLKTARKSFRRHKSKTAVDFPQPR
uniref:Uncharacterized protein n=1 Tax=Anopheles minimus TaxID=112268 RepID=A0A182WN70_9DIPT